MGNTLVRILCAQGRKSERLPLCEILRRERFEVWEATTAGEVLRLAGEHPALVVLEDSLLDLPAGEVLHRLRSKTATAGLPVLYLDPRGNGGGAGEWDGYLGPSARSAEVMAWVRVLVRRPESARLESLGRLAAGVAHDVNNLLTVVLGHAGLLESILPAGSSARGLLSGIELAAHTASDLATHLLALAREQPITPGPVDINALVQNLMALLRRAIDPRVEILLETRPVPMVLGVPSQITQVLLNLSLNARDAMPAGGKLTVGTETLRTPAGPFVRLRFADNGTGIPADVLPHVFDSFFTTRSGQGTGLGLATVRQLVGQHQGRIECTSEVGQGTCFDVFLPALAGQH
jgi:signal transduction histidine kinase